MKPPSLELFPSVFSALSHWWSQSNPQVINKNNGINTGLGSLQNAFSMLAHLILKRALPLPLMVLSLQAFALLPYKDSLPEGWSSTFQSTGQQTLFFLIDMFFVCYCLYIYVY